MDEDAARRARERRRREDLLAGLRLEARLLKANPVPPARAEEDRARRYERIAGILHQVEEGSPDASYVDADTEALLRGELARIAQEGATAPQTGAAPATPLVAVERSNTILYCLHWLPTVRFYRDDLAMRVLAESDWYVEFRVTGMSSLSVADGTRTTIHHVGGQGITLSWRVTDLAATRRRLADRALQPTEIRAVGDAATFYVWDPEGHRVELWSHRPPAGNRPS